MSAPMGCRQAVLHLWEYLDRGLDEADHHAVDEHLAWCRRCCGELEFAKHLRGLLRTRGSEELPADVQARLERVIDDINEFDDTTGAHR